MATRLYLPSSGAAAVNPPFTLQASWDQTGSADRLRMVTTKSATAMTSLTQASTITSNQRQLVRQYVSDPIAGQVLAVGTIKGTIRVAESATNDNINAVASKVLVVSNDGQTLRGAISNLSHTLVSVNEWATVAVGLTNRRVADGDATSAVTSQEGDRIVIELGYSTTVGGSSISGNMNFGDDAASDCADDEAGTAANNPFVELSITVEFLALSALGINRRWQGVEPQALLIGAGGLAA
jgi:hypothetical protein